MGATPLQAFAAGASLCSTSLGTTFAVLKASGLERRRLGTVLSGAAMMDDVVALVVVRVIEEIGVGGGTGVQAGDVLRPVGVSVGVLVGVLVGCRWIVGPLRRRYGERAAKFWMGGEGGRGGVLGRVGVKEVQWGFVWQTLLLVGFVTGATYAGTSGLFAAYLAGVVVSWWDGIGAPNRSLANDRRDNEVSDSVASLPNAPTADTPQTIDPPNSTPKSTPDSPPPQSTMHTASPVPLVPIAQDVYTTYYSAVVTYLLKPLFFASIGFSIPITAMFVGPIAWRGIVYALLMLMGKLVTGLWLVRLPSFSIPTISTLSKIYFLKDKIARWFPFPRKLTVAMGKENGRGTSSGKGERGGTGSSVQSSQLQQETLELDSISPQPLRRSPIFTPEAPTNPSTPLAPSPPAISSTPPQPSRPAKPISLHPSLILGLAMTARGEIGFLIASLAYSRGIFSSPSTTTSTPSSSPSSVPSDADPIYLVVIWAIVLCTIIGPLGVGVAVRRVRRLERGITSAEGGGEGRRAAVLGVWGVG
jgi:Kef-type K+ transport system membrane component KefB